MAEASEREMRRCYASVIAPNEIVICDQKDDEGICMRERPCRFRKINWHLKETIDRVEKEIQDG